MDGFDEYGDKGKMARAEYEPWTGRYLTPKTELYNEEGE